MSFPVLPNLPPCLHYADGEVRLVGHRINLFHVVKLLRRGYTPEQIREAYDWPPDELALIQQVIEFYHARRAEVDAYADEYQADLDRQEAAAVPSPALLRIRALMEARRSKNS